MKAVEAKNLLRPMFGRPAAKPAIAATEIHHFHAAQVREQRSKRGPFGCAIESLDRTARNVVLKDPYS